MKKLCIVLFSSLFLIACASGNEAEENKTAANTGESDEAGIEVDKGLLNVEITLPEMFFQDDELEDIEAEMEKTHNANVTKNDDGSLTVKMSTKEHKQLMSNMQEEFIDTINGIVESDDYPSIQDITYNRSMSELKVKVNGEQFENGLDGLALFSLGFTSLFYQLFDGKDLTKDKVTMAIIDEETDEVIEEVVYPNVFEDLDDFMDEDFE